MEPKAFEVYRHFKGNLYQVITLAEDEGSGNMLVIYQALYTPFKVYARPLASFTEKVNRVKYPDASQEYRFELVRDLTATALPVSGENTKEPEMKPEEKTTEEKLTEEKSAASGGINPDLLLFLDAKEPEEKLDAMFQIKGRLTSDMLTAMEISQGMEPQENLNVEERYKRIKNDIITKQKYEHKRI